MLLSALILSNDKRIKIIGVNDPDKRCIDVAIFKYKGIKVYENY